MKLWKCGVNAKLRRIERRVKDDEKTRCILHLHTARVRVLQFESATHRKREKRVLSNIKKTYHTAVRPRNVSNCGIARPKRS